MVLFIVSLISFALVAVLTLGVIKFAPRLGLVDIPVARSAHSIPKPLGGGVALAVPYFLCVTWLSANGVVSDSLQAYLACLFIMLLGFYDDRWRLASRVRLPLQLLLGFVAVRSIGVATVDFGFFMLADPYVLTLLAVLSIVWLANLTNFMDGIDGIAGSQLLSTSLSCILLLLVWESGGTKVVSGNIALDAILILSTVLVASALGFLLWNWSPARLFMGDAGSGFIGFSLGLLALETLVSQRMSVWSWVLLLGVFIADTAVTLAARIVRGAIWYEGHSQHAYQILARRLESHGRVVLLLLSVNFFWLLPLAWLAGILSDYGVLFAIIGLLPLLVVCYRLGAGRAEVV